MQDIDCTLSEERSKGLMLNESMNGGQIMQASHCTLMQCAPLRGRLHRNRRHVHPCGACRKHYIIIGHKRRLYAIAWRSCSCKVTPREAMSATVW